MWKINYNEPGCIETVQNFGDHSSATLHLTKAGYHQWRRSGCEHCWQHRISGRMLFLTQEEAGWKLSNKGEIAL